MTETDLAILLATMALTFLLAAWLGRRSGDAPRDVRLMTGMGGVLAAFAGLLAVAFAD
jgi:hypothetical protein